MKTLQENERINAHEKWFTAYSKTIGQRTKTEKYLSVSDIDYIVRRRYKSVDNVMIVEKKIDNRRLSQTQKITYRIIDAALKFFCATQSLILNISGFRKVKQSYKYRGFHVLTFTGISFEDGPVYWNNIQIFSTDELDKIMTFQANPKFYKNLFFSKE